MTFIFYSPNLRGMKDTEAKPGRPLKYAERLERVQVMLTGEQREAAEQEANERGVSVSTVYRDWIDAGRAVAARKRKRT